ncbi:MAG: DUF3617 domain-containing protein [Hyphomicrobium sp.]
MRFGTLISGIVATAAGVSAAVGESATSALQAGAYEVAVRLELPHVSDAGVSKVAITCVAPVEKSPQRGLVVLSENNPLAKCPASNINDAGDTLTFDIVCPGGNAAIASATYRMRGDAFEGRIAMKMGGKNMTMTETQSGRLKGPCTAPSGM